MPGCKKMSSYRTLFTKTGAGKEASEVARGNNNREVVPGREGPDSKHNFWF